MKLFIPKSYKVRDKILETLAKKRHSLEPIKDIKDCKLSIKEISKLINEDFEYVSFQLDYLFYSKLIHSFKNSEDLTNPYNSISDEGLSSFSSKSILNDGKLLQSSIFNNITSGLFQIIVGIIAVVSICMNYQDSKLYNEKVNTMQKDMDSIQLKLLMLTKEKSTENNFYDTKADYQTNSQTDDKESAKVGQSETNN